MLIFSQCEYYPHITVQFSIYNVYIESSLLHTVLFTITHPSIPIFLFTYAFLFTMRIFFHSYCIIFYSTMFTVRLHWTHAVLFTITLPSIQSVLFTYASFSQCDIFSQSLPNWLYNNVYSIALTYTFSTVYNYSTQYTDFAVYICIPFHNMIFFHTYCTIVYMTMFTLNLLCLHAVLFIITLPSMLIVLCIYILSLSQW